MNEHDKLKADIGSKVEQLTLPERLARIDEIHKEWVVSLTSESKEDNMSNILSNSLKRFDITPDLLSIKKFKDKQTQTVIELLFLKKYIENPKDMNILKYTNKLNEIVKILVDLENLILSFGRFQDTILDTEKTILPKSMELMLFSEENFAKNTPMQNLLIYILKCLMNDKLKRIKNECYEKVYTEECYDTKTWKLKCSIEQYIYSKCQREVKCDMWKNLTQCSISTVVDHLTNCADLSFTDIKKDRHVFSFSNGIYYICHNYYTNIEKDILTDFKDVFIPYKKDPEKPQPECDIPRDTTSSKFHNKHFNEQYMLYEDAFDIIKLHCPSLLNLMTYQKWEEDVQRQLCIMIGRCMYYVGTDNWQVIPFMLGLAGTGKSTIIMLVKMIYEAMDVSVLSNNMQTTFGMDTVADKFMFIAPEVKSNFKLDQSEFQSMVTGESMSLNQKNKQTLNIEKWVVPGIMAGNEVFGYTDAAGSIVRRIVLFMFKRKIKKEHSDPQLPLKLRTELPDIMLACNRLYLQAVNQNGSKDIWSILPKYFHDNRDSLEESTNYLVKYLRSGEIVFNSKFWIRENTLSEAFKDYCNRMSYHCPRWNEQYTMGPFSARDIESRKDQRGFDDAGQLFVGTIYFGLDVRGYIHKDIDDENICYNDEGEVVKPPTFL